MTIDLHARVWSSPDQFGPELSRLLRLRQADRWIRLDASASALERASACVDVTLIHGFRSQHLGARIPNELIAEVVAQSPSHRLGVAGADPLASGPASEPERQVSDAVKLGMVGVSISPMCQGFHPSHSQAMRLYACCEAHRLPLFVARGAPLSSSAILEFGRPSAWDEVARAHPTLPIVLGELGYPWIDEAFALAGKHDNVWVEVSGVASRPWQLYNALQTALGLGLMDKILFGSGFPYETPARAIENIYSLNALSHGTQLPSIPRALLQAVVERDALRCLGLDAEVDCRAPSQRSRVVSGVRQAASDLSLDAHGGSTAALGVASAAGPTAQPGSGSPRSTSPSNVSHLESGGT
jgi:hypothetical protein